MPDLYPRLTATLQKLRKGNFGSLYLTDLFDVLTYWGWKIKDDAVVPHTFTKYKTFRKEDKNLAQTTWQLLKNEEINNLPARLQEGKKYITDVKDLETRDLTPEEERWQATFILTYNETGGVKAYEITSPDNKDSVVFGPEKDEFFKERKFSVKKLITLLFKKTNFKQQIENNVTLIESVPAALRTRDNTGTCPVCFRNVKLERGKIFFHGYKRPGYGWLVGGCFGSGKLPFELSPEGSKEFVSQMLEPHLAQSEKQLQDLKTGKVTKFTRTRGTYNKMVEEITPENPRWKQHLEGAIHSTEYDIRTTKSQIEQYKNEIAHWVLRELPKEGDNIFKRWTDPVVKKVATRYLTRFK
jgi:hypothetical protein